MQRTSLAPLLSATRRRDSCWIIWLPRPFQHLHEAPALELRQRAGLLDPHAVADLAVVGLVVGVELLGPHHRLLVERMGLAGGHGDDGGLVHAGAGDDALADL